MSASNWNPVLEAFHDRFKAAGKLPKVVIVAVMRKMITAFNAMVRDDVVWADHLSLAIGTVCRPQVATALIDLVGSRP
jgi:transposase